MTTPATARPVEAEECAYSLRDEGMESCLAPALYVVIEPYDPPEMPTIEVFACAWHGDAIRRDLAARGAEGGYRIKSLPRH